MKQKNTSKKKKKKRKALQKIKKERELLSKLRYWHLIIIEILAYFIENHLFDVINLLIDLLFRFFSVS